MAASPDADCKIVERKPVQGDPNTVRVLFNTGDSVLLSVSDWVHLGLKVGQMVDEELHTRLSAYEAIHQALTMAVSYLTGRVRTAGQVLAYLERKEIPADIAASVLGRLQEFGIVDDQRYAQMFVEQVGERTGRAQILAKLMRRGIDSHIAREAVEQNLSPDIERSAAEAAAEKFVRRHGRPENYPERMKMLQYLVRRGFQYSVASQATEAACKR